VVAKWMISSLQQGEVTSSRAGVRGVILVKPSSHKALEPSAVDRKLGEPVGGTRQPYGSV